MKKIPLKNGLSNTTIWRNFNNSTPIFQVIGTIILLNQEVNNASGWLNQGPKIGDI